MSLSIVVAVADNGVIGRDGALPWHLPDDLRHFRQLTMGKPILMGRRTFESIGRPLPNRQTIVLTRSLEPIVGVSIVSDLSQLEALARQARDRDIFICGGAQIYEQTLPLCSDLYLTLVNRVVAGDVFFPPFEDQFDLVIELRSFPEFKVLHYRRRANPG